MLRMLRATSAVARQRGIRIAARFSPPGLSLMLRAMSNWLYDRDPFRPLQWTEDLQRFKVPSISYTPMPSRRMPRCASRWPGTL